MTDDDVEFIHRTIEPLESALQEHPIGGLFSGELYYRGDQPLTELELEDFGNGPFILSAREVGRLFMAPDGSVVAINSLPEQDNGTPAGVNVKSDNDFVQENDPVAVVAYQDVDGRGVRINSLHLARVMLVPDAPGRLCTIAFGMMACTAFRRGFKKITLFAGGNGPPPEELEEGDLVGYMVWPKFGFDATLLPVDLNRAPERLRQCSSVLEVIGIDETWWGNSGRGRDMTFDLTAGSRSWNVLLNYLFRLLDEEAQ